MPELTKKSTIPDGLKAFVHLGILPYQEARDVTSSNFSLECPFCGADKGLGVVLQEKTKEDGQIVAPGMWHCFKCSESGNTVSLLQKVFAQCQQGDLAPLANDRKLPVDILQEYRIIEAPYTQNQYWVPIFNESDTLINIYRYDLALKAKGDPLAFTGCAGVSAGLFNAQTLSSPPPGNDLSAKDLSVARAGYPCYICEGHWDTIALDHVLRDVGHRSESDVLGQAGAGNFQASWFRILDGRSLVLLYDYDPPKERNGKIIQAGADGIQRTIKLAKRAVEFKPASIKIMEWKV
jgi:hypothetical protein